MYVTLTFLSHRLSVPFSIWFFKMQISLNLNVHMGQCFPFWMKSMYV
jgi:hypothetical protein